MTTKPAPKPVTMDIKTTVATYGFSRADIYRKLAAGKLRAIKNGHRTLIITESADEVVAEMPAATFRAPSGQSAPDARGT